MNWQKVFLFWFLLFPFVIWDQSYEAPKIIWLFLGSFALCFFWIIKLSRSPSFVIKNYDIFYFLWLLSLLVSSFLGPHPIDSIIGGGYRHQGVLFFFAIWLVGKTISLLDKANKELLLKVLCFEVIVESIFLFFNPLGTFGERNAAAGFITIAASLIGNKFVLFFAFASSIFVVSRSAVLSFLPNIQRLRKNKWFGLVLISTIVATLLVFTYASRLRPNVPGFENRGLITQVALTEIIKKPILGYGAESGVFVYDNHFKSINISLENLMIDRSHNLILDLLMWSGIIGLILFSLWFIYRTRHMQKIRLLALFSWLIFSMFQPLGTVHWLLLLTIFDL